MSDYFIMLIISLVINLLSSCFLPHMLKMITCLSTLILYVRGNMVDAFRVHIMQTKELGTCPVRQIGGCSFFYMRISNVYIVIVVSSNANVACAFKFVVEVVSFFSLTFSVGFFFFPSQGPSSFWKYLINALMCV